MLAHDLAGAFSIFKKARVSNLTFQLVESLAFTLDQKIEIHWCFCRRGALSPRMRRPAERGGYRIQLRVFAATRRLCAAVAARELHDSDVRLDTRLFACKDRIAGAPITDFNIRPI